MMHLIKVKLHLFNISILLFSEHTKESPTISQTIKWNCTFLKYCKSLFQKAYTIALIYSK